MTEDFRHEFKNRLIASTIFFLLFFTYLLLLPGISTEKYLFIAALFSILILNSIPFLLGKSVKDDQHPYAYLARPATFAAFGVDRYNKRLLTYLKFQTFYYSRKGLLITKSIYLADIFLILMLLYLLYSIIVSQS